MRHIYFFFQAEDGIRDVAVTGVQTCALPISVSAEGKLQVELAQLEYNLPRMRGMWKHLERLGGGVGTRGPGESQLETDRRLARRRITILRGRLKQLSRQRTIRRRERERAEAPTLAPAG